MMRKKGSRIFVVTPVEKTKTTKVGFPSLEGFKNSNFEFIFERRQMTDDLNKSSGFAKRRGVAYGKQRIIME